MSFTFPANFGDNSFYFSNIATDHLINDYIEDKILKTNKEELLHNIQHICSNKALLKKLFFKAISRQNSEIILTLLNANKIDVNDSDNHGITIFMKTILQMGNSVDEWDLEIIKVILDRTQNIDAQDDLGNTALMKTKNYCIALKLINNGASLSIRNAAGQTPLLVAAKNGLDDLIDLYIDRGASILDVDNDGWTALMLAAHIDNNISTIKKLLPYSLKIINYQNEIGLTALKIAIFNKNRAAMIKLLKNGAFFNDAENMDVSELNLRNIEIIESRSNTQRIFTIVWKEEKNSFYF
ncbi:MAG: hypothetical protein KR126chlam4_01261 [Candidatus Anoxychlamydiales bacterium]|nr:hypothetical protein [Candidatus Anoxychlamydiales bacterium]